MLVVYTAPRSGSPKKKNEESLIMTPTHGKTFLPKNKINQPRPSSQREKYNKAATLSNRWVDYYCTAVVPGWPPRVDHNNNSTITTQHCPKNDREYSTVEEGAEAVLLPHHIVVLQLVVVFWISYCACTVWSSSVPAFFPAGRSIAPW